MCPPLENKNKIKRFTFCKCKNLLKHMLKLSGVMWTSEVLYSLVSLKLMRACISTVVLTAICRVKSGMVTTEYYICKLHFQIDKRQCVFQLINIIRIVKIRQLWLDKTLFYTGMRYAMHLRHLPFSN